MENPEWNFLPAEYAELQIIFKKCIWKTCNIF